MPLKCTDINYPNHLKLSNGINCSFLSDSLQSGSTQYNLKFNIKPSISSSLFRKVKPSTTSVTMLQDPKMLQKVCADQLAQSTTSNCQEFNLKSGGKFHLSVSTAHGTDKEISSPSECIRKQSIETLNLQNTMISRSHSSTTNSNQHRLDPQLGQVKGNSVKQTDKRSIIGSQTKKTKGQEVSSSSSFLQNSTCQQQHNQSIKSAANVMTKNEKIQQERSSCSSEVRVNKSESVKQVFTTPTPKYEDCRPKLYDWVRTLCVNLRMSLEVLGLAMKYIDEYHQNHPYDRSKFIVLAHAAVTIASKISVKKVVSIVTCSKMLKVDPFQIVKQEAELVEMFDFSCYRHTWVHRMEDFVEKYERECHLRHISQKVGFFEPNEKCFTRFYRFVLEVERFARVQYGVSDEQILESFVTVLLPVFEDEDIFNGQGKSVLVEILEKVFQTKQKGLNLQGTIKFPSLQKINEPLPLNTEGLQQTFKRKEDTTVYPSYSLVLTSVFLLKPNPIN